MEPLAGVRVLRGSKVGTGVGDDGARLGPDGIMAEEAGGGTASIGGAAAGGAIETGGGTTIGAVAAGGAAAGGVGAIGPPSGGPKSGGGIAPLAVVVSDVAGGVVGIVVTGEGLVLA